MTGYTSLQGPKSLSLQQAERQMGPALAFCYEGHPNLDIPHFTSVKIQALLAASSPNFGAVSDSGTPLPLVPTQCSA